MTNTWFTADHHFDHANIIKYANRPFSSVEEMDAVMVERWNSTIAKEDTVYHLGDFTLGGWYAFLKYFKLLNGHIHIIPGGHDHRWLNEGKNTIDWYWQHIVEQPLFLLEIPKKEQYPLTIVLCHYSLRVWDRSHYGSLHLYGHSHGTLPGLGRSMDVGVDTNNFYPYHLDEIVERLSVLEIHNKPVI